MCQHFLLSAKARTLSLKAIYKGGEDKAYETFKRLRWPETDGEPVCPKCGCLEHYNITTRRRFKCAGCGSQFSVTSGTIFASRKLSFMDLCGAVAIFVNAVKGLSALQLGRDLSVSYKTAFVLAHKLREALGTEAKGVTLEGEVEIDGAYFGGHVRPENRKEDRKDRRLCPPAPHGGRAAPLRYGSLPPPVRRRGRLEGGQPSPPERRCVQPHDWSDDGFAGQPGLEGLLAAQRGQVKGASLDLTQMRRGRAIANARIFWTRAAHCPILRLTTRSIWIKEQNGSQGQHHQFQRRRRKDHSGFSVSRRACQIP